jgi:hypothetical protein
MEKRKSLNVRMSNELNAYLRKQAFALEISLNQLILNALTKWRKEHKKDIDTKWCYGNIAILITGVKVMRKGDKRYQVKKDHKAGWLIMDMELETIFEKFITREEARKAAKALNEGNINGT